MKESLFKKLEPAFWLAYVLVLMFTGLLTRHSLPNEYDKERHVLLESHFEECGPEGLESCEVPDEWRDDKTGKIYTSEQFKEHHHSEAKRIGVTAFAYGLIGCLFFAYSRVVRVHEKFPKGLQKAIAINIIFSLFMYWIA